MPWSQLTLIQGVKSAFARRSPSPLRQRESVKPRVYLVGCLYNFCWPQASLRLHLWIPESRCHWVQRTSVMASLTIGGLFSNR